MLSQAVTPLPLEALVAQGIPARAVEAWQAEGIQRLTPLQAEAVARHGILQGRSAIILAPTSAGKTLVAELAALRHLEQGRRTIFLVPTKALAEERGAEFARRFGRLGARVVIATRERPEADARVQEGSWDLLVAIYEKVRAFLVARPALFAEVGLIVADEMQLVGELGRGESVELLLTKRARQPRGGAQFLGLSAVLGDAERLGAWLGCEVIAWRERPVPLREGVLCAEDGLFRYHDGNAQRTGEERLLSEGIEPDNPDALLRAAVRELVETRGESCLVFAPTKRVTRDWALMLAESLALPCAEKALAHLETMEPSRNRTALTQTLRGGVAFHNADLPWALRGAVERAFDGGEVRALVATSTLAQGVNLTGRNVIVWPQEIATDRWTGETITAAISRARFQNAGGRAGRLGREAEFGRAILLAGTRAEAERLMRLHVGQPPEPMRPGLGDADLAPVIMDLIATGTARTPGEVEEFLLATHTGLARWQREPRAAWDDRWLPALERLECAHLTRRDEEGALEATGLGREMARAGVALKTARLFQRWLAAIEDPPHALEALWCAARSADGTEAAVPLPWNERRSQTIPSAMRNALGESMHPMTREWLAPEGGLAVHDLAAMKRALLAWAWLGDEPTEGIESTFGVHAGLLENVAAHLAWLLETLANMATALGHPDPLAAGWRAWARRLPLGLPAAGMGWAGWRRRGVGRTHVRALVAEGFSSPRDLEGADLDTLSHAVPAPIAKALLGDADEIATRVSANGHIPTPATEKKYDLPEIDVETGTVKWHGCETRLPPMPARLLALLRSRAPRAVPYREIEDHLWGTGLASERQQVSAHLRRAVKMLSAIAPGEAERLIEVRAGQGLRMRG